VANNNDNQGIIIICYILHKKYGAKFQKKVERQHDCERRKGAAKTRKRCAFKNSSVSYVAGLTTVAKKQPKKTTCFFDPPFLLNGPRGLFTVLKVLPGIICSNTLAWKTAPIPETAPCSSSSETYLQNNIPRFRIELRAR